MAEKVAKGVELGQKGFQFWGWMGRHDVKRVMRMKRVAGWVYRVGSDTFLRTAYEGTGQYSRHLKFKSVPIL